MTISSLSKSERPLSEEFRLVAKKFADLEAAASLLEETKSAVLSQMMLKLGDIPVSKAEMRVKGSDEWSEHIAKIVEARKEANLAKFHLEYIRLKHSEMIMADANHRHERRIG